MVYSIKYKIDNLKHSVNFNNKIKNNKIKNNKWIITKEQNDIFIDLKKILNEWIKIADKYNIEWWLCSGSLLGALRHNGFIPWDNDIDICVPNKYYNLLKKLVKTENKVITLDKVAIGFRAFVENNNFPYMDIWMVDINRYNCVSFCAPYHNEKKTYYFTYGFPNDYFHLNELYPLKTCMFENIQVYIPFNGLNYVLKKYGNDCLTNGIIYPHTQIHSIMRIVPLEYLFEKIIIKKLISFEKTKKINKKQKLSLIIIKLIGMVTESEKNYIYYIKLLMKFLFHFIYYL